MSHKFTRSGVFLEYASRGQANQSQKIRVFVVPDVAAALWQPLLKGMVHGERVETSSSGLDARQFSFSIVVACNDFLRAFCGTLSTALLPPTMAMCQMNSRKHSNECRLTNWFCCSRLPK
jgi:hypothetical protein